MGTWHERKSAAVEAVSAKHATAKSTTQVIPEMPQALPSTIVRASGTENPNSKEDVQAAAFESPGRSAARGAWLTGAIMDEDHTSPRPTN